jgi:hypothetical protein
MAQPEGKKKALQCRRLKRNRADLAFYFKTVLRVISQFGTELAD